MKYMVMECHPGYAVVLSDDGRFLKVANMRYEVGQTVANVVEMCLPQSAGQPAKKNDRRWIRTLAAMAACLALVVTSVFFAGQLPYASVYMTINPEVRIDVNRSDVVVGVEGINTDGTDLLEGYDHRKKNLDTVMDELVDRAIDMGYLHEGGRITLCLDADEKWITSHGEHLNTHLSEHLTDKITVTIDVEQKKPDQPPQTVPTISTGTIVIPVAPDSYGEAPTDDGDVENTPFDDGTSDYESPDEGQSGYDDGQTDYDAPTDDNGQSDYNDTSGGSMSNYGDASDDGMSNDTEDGQWAYGSSDADDFDDGQSDYTQSDDGNSPYEESDDD